MNEGLGNTIVIVVIVVFIALVSGYMAYNVNYTKAFRMKNKIVATYEKYDGICTEDPPAGSMKSCLEEIREYATEIGYHPSTNDFCGDNVYRPKTNVLQTRYVSDPGYCEYTIKVPKRQDTRVVNDYNHKDGYYYTIATIINIRVPIIENYMQFNYVSGDTKDFANKR